MNLQEECLAEAISTPAVVVDIDVAARNIGRFQAYADAHGLRVRPHIKTHKLPAIAEMQLSAGAIGITCQKISEAEAMVAGSAAIRDVLITYNIVGDDKLAALRALASRIKISVVADNPIVVDGLSAAFAGAEPLDRAGRMQCRGRSLRRRDARGGARAGAPHRRRAGPRLRRVDDVSAGRRRRQNRGVHGGGQSG